LAELTAFLRPPSWNLGILLVIEGRGKGESNWGKKDRKCMGGEKERGSGEEGRQAIPQFTFLASPLQEQ